VREASVLALLSHAETQSGEIWYRFRAEGRSRITMVQPRPAIEPPACSPKVNWPDFGRMTLQNKEGRREPVRSILAGQPANAQVAGMRGTVYGSEGWGFESLRMDP
jgi:hypothetical protein